MAKVTMKVGLPDFVKEQVEEQFAKLERQLIGQISDEPAIPSIILTKTMKYMDWSASLLLNMTIQGEHINYTCTQGLPKGTKVVDCYYMPRRECIRFIVEHPDFEDMGDDHIYPVFVTDYGNPSV